MAKSRKPRAPKSRRYAGGGTSISSPSPDHFIPKWMGERNEGAHCEMKATNMLVMTAEENDKAIAHYEIYFRVTKTIERTAAIMEAAATAINGAPAPVYRPSLILDLLVPYDRAQDMQANLGDLYPVWVERYGVRRANFIRRCQVAWLVGGTWWEKLLSSGERLLKVFRIVGS